MARRHNWTLWQILAALSLTGLTFGAVVWLGQPRDAAATLLADAPPAGSALVGPGGTDSGNCQFAKCLTINYALSQAGASGTVAIQAGTYTETVAASAAQTLLGGYDSGFSVRTPGSSIVQPASGDALQIAGTVTVDGLTAKGAPGAGIRITGGTVTVTMSTITANMSSGIVVESGGQHLLISNTIANNGGATTAQGGGLLVKDSSVVTVRYSDIRGNRAGAANSFGGGIAVLTDAVATVDNNTIRDNQSNGSGGRGGGLAAQGAAGVVESNQFTGNVAPSSGSAVLLDNSPILLGNNLISGSTGGVSVAILGGNNNQLTGNTVQNNSGGVLIDTTTGSFTFSGNTLAGNSGVISGALQVNNSVGYVTNNTVRSHSASGMAGIAVTSNPGTVYVTGNVVTGTTGNGISVLNSVGFTYLISNSVFSNTGTGIAVLGGSGYYELTNNAVAGNSGAGTGGGGLALSAGTGYATNNLVVFNGHPTRGAGVWVGGGTLNATFMTIDNNTLGGLNGDGVFVAAGATLVMSNSIISRQQTGLSNVGATVTLDYLDLWAAPIGSASAGSHSFVADPKFVAGPLGCHYLSQTSAGQGSNSPAVDGGAGDIADFIGYTTRTDNGADNTVPDLGYHYPQSGGLAMSCGFSVNPPATPVATSTTVATSTPCPGCTATPSPTPCPGCTPTPTITPCPGCSPTPTGPSGKVGYAPIAVKGRPTGW